MATVSDQILLSIERFPLNLLYRAAIGAVMVPVYQSCLAAAGLHDEVIVFLTFVALVLLALRVVPGLLRRFIPASREVTATWAERRYLAQIYDSFQWRKLPGLGLGLGASLVINHDSRRDALAIAILFLVGGVIGEVCWRNVCRSGRVEFSA